MKTILAVPSLGRRAEFLDAVARSRKLHAAWVAPPGSSEAFNQYLKRFNSPSHVSSWILTETDHLAGVVNINEIVRGLFQSGYLSYYGFAPHNGQGYMTEGIRAVISRAFRRLGLHRLEANIQPGNYRSRNLIQGLGFKLEGFSPRYLKIAGKWRDHERWALLSDEFNIPPKATHQPLESYKRSGI